MNRPVILLLLGVLALAALSAAGWYLAFGVGRQPPGRLDLAGLNSEVELTWLTGGSVRVSGSVHATDGSTESVIGAAQALTRPWLTFLVRQAALGRLAEWIGPSGVPLDRLVRALDIGAAAERGFDSLDAQSRQRLTAFSDGINAALKTRRVRQAPQVASLGVEPEPWEPWHTVAVERLYAWLAATPDGVAAPNLMAERDRLSALLHLGGLDQGAVWSLGESLFVRFVYGDAGVPPLMEFAFDDGDLVTWIGMPYPWAGHSQSAAWARLPASRYHVLEVRPDTRVPELRYERVFLKDGGIEVAAYRRSLEGLWLDAGHVLKWSGFDTVSDADAWFSNGARSLTTGAGIHRDAGQSVVLGPQEWSLQLPRGHLVTSARYRPALGLRLTVVGDDDVLPPQQLFLDVRSGWAEPIVRQIVGRIRPNTATAGTPLADAITYLRNWDAAYSDDAIGATLFDGVMTRLQGARDPESIERALTETVNALQRRLGADLRRWRWEAADSLMLFFPGADALPGRYAPVALHRAGHPSVPAWSSSAYWNSSATHAAWEGVISGTGLAFRRPSVPFDRFLGRFLPTEGLALPRLVSEIAPTGMKTVLRPAPAK